MNTLEQMDLNKIHTYHVLLFYVLGNAFTMYTTMYQVKAFYCSLSSLRGMWQMYTYGTGG